MHKYSVLLIAPLKSIDAPAGVILKAVGKGATFGPVNTRANINFSVDHNLTIDELANVKAAFEQEYARHGVTVLTISKLSA
jgi:hypothetical protein